MMRRLAKNRAWRRPVPRLWHCLGLVSIFITEAPTGWAPPLETQLTDGPDRADKPSCHGPPGTPELMVGSLRHRRFIIVYMGSHRRHPGQTGVGDGLMSQPIPGIGFCWLLSRGTNARDRSGQRASSRPWSHHSASAWFPLSGWISIWTRRWLLRGLGLPLRTCMQTARSYGC